MREKYVQELERLKERMLKAEKFAKKLPIFSKQIIEDKLTGEEYWIRFESRYKDFYSRWGIDRGWFVKGTRREVINYKGKPYSEFLFCIYVNTYSLFNRYTFRVDEVADKANLFFYDSLNSTFYATDEQITDLLEEINKWYIKTRGKNEILMAEKEKEEAEKRLKKAQTELDNLTSQREGG